MCLAHWFPTYSKELPARFMPENNNAILTESVSKWRDYLSKEFDLSYFFETTTRSKRPSNARAVVLICATERPSIDTVTTCGPAVVVR